MAKNTHKKTSKKKSGMARTAAKRLTKQPPNGAARNGSDMLNHVDKANAHLMKALEMIRESRARARRANKTSQKWRKSLTTRTS